MTEPKATKSCHCPSAPGSGKGCQLTNDECIARTKCQYEAYPAARELMATLIMHELFDPQCETDKDVMASIIAGGLTSAYMAGKESA